MKNLSDTIEYEVNATSNTMVWTFQQFDDGVIRLALVHKNNPVFLIGQAFRLFVRKPDNVVVELSNTNNFKVSMDNEVDIHLMTNMMDVPGICTCELQLEDFVGERTIAPFTYAVKPVFGEQASSVIAENYSDELERLVIDTNNKLSQFTEDVAKMDEMKLDIADLKPRVEKNKYDIVSLNTQLDDVEKEKISKGEGGVITNAMLSQEVKEAIVGGSVAVVGDDSILNRHIIDDQISLEKIKHIDFGGFSFASTSTFAMEFTAISSQCEISLTGQLWLTNGKNIKNSHLIPFYFGKADPVINGWDRPILNTGTCTADYQNYTFILDHNEYLVWNMKDKTIDTKTATSIFNKFDVVLAFCHVGEIKGGIFFEIKNYLRIKASEQEIDDINNKLNDYSNMYFSSYGDDLIFTPNGNNCDISTKEKSEMWIQLAGAGVRAKQFYLGWRTDGSYERPILNTGTFTDDHYEFNLPHNHVLLYNTDTNMINAENGITYKFKKNDYILAFCHGGDVKSGIFRKIKDYYVNIHLQDEIDDIKNDNSDLPEYLKEEVEKVSNSVMNKQTLNSATFAFIADMHYNYGQKNIHRALQSVKELCKNVTLDFISLGGDNTEDGVKATVIKSNDSLKHYLNGTNYYGLNGNHDDNTIYDVDYIHSPTSINHLTITERYNRLYRGNDCLRDYENKQMYYYHDDVNNKIRYIHLNSIDIPYILENGLLKYKGQWDYAYSNEQLNWLANKALKLEGDDWGVVVFTHVPPIRSISYTGDKVLNNGDVLVEILKAYKNKSAYTSTPTTGDFGQSVTVDFTSQSSNELICVIYGHVHQDMVNDIDGIKYISTLNCKCSKDWDVAPERTLDTISEVAFDLFNIDRKERKINAIRFGAGADREILY